MIYDVDSSRTARRAFEGFGARYSSRIDLSIGKFFSARINNADDRLAREIYTALSEYCLRRGKRIRPLFLLIAYEGYAEGRGGMGRVIALSGALELMHSMLLIQDDIIDRSDVRRGGESLHVLMERQFGDRSSSARIGADIALVAADMLFAGAVEIIGISKIKPSVKDEFLKLFGRTYESTARGQILDSLHTRAMRLGEEHDAGRISLMKTAWYTVCYPLLMGYACAGGGREAEKKRITEFALPLGLAFQIRDDLLGVFGDGEDIGKSVDSDLAEGKLTLLVSETLARLKGRQRRSFLRIFNREGKSARDLSLLRGFIVKSGGLEAAGRRHEELIAESIERLEALGISRSARLLLRGAAEAIREVRLSGSLVRG